MNKHQSDYNNLLVLVIITIIHKLLLLLLLPTTTPARDMIGSLKKSEIIITESAPSSMPFPKNVEKMKRLFSANSLKSLNPGPFIVTPRGGGRLSNPSVITSQFERVGKKMHSLTFFISVTEDTYRKRV